MTNMVVVTGFFLNKRQQMGKGLYSNQGLWSNQGNTYHDLASFWKEEAGGTFFYPQYL